MMTDPAQRSRVPVVVLISGRGSNMQTIVQATRDPSFPAQVTGVISNRPDAGGLRWAKEEGVPASCVDHKAFESREDFDAALHWTLLSYGAQIVVLAGFMRIMTAEFVNRWQGRMINIHPSLLPLFQGLNTHQRALDAGMTVAGCTVHYVTPDLDGGPIIAQAAVPVLPDDTSDSLAARVLKTEHKLYPEALRLVAQGDAPLIDGRVALNAMVNADQQLLSLGKH